MLYLIDSMAKNKTSLDVKVTSNDPICKPKSLNISAMPHWTYKYLIFDAVYGGNLQAKLKLDHAKTLVFTVNGDQVLDTDIIGRLNAGETKNMTVELDGRDMCKLRINVHKS